MLHMHMAALRYTVALSLHQSSVWLLSNANGPLACCLMCLCKHLLLYNLHYACMQHAQTGGALDWRKAARPVDKHQSDFWCTNLPQHGLHTPWFADVGTVFAECARVCPYSHRQPQLCAEGDQHHKSNDLHVCVRFEQFVSRKQYQT